MNSPTPLRLIQFRAAYNLPVHVAVELGHFARHDLEVDVAYTPGSAYLSKALKAGKFQIGHTAADDVIADVESHAGGRSDLFIFMGLHSGLLSLVGSPEIPDVESLRGKSLAVDARTTGFVFVLERMLRSRGLGPENYHLVEVGGWERRYQALMEGKFSATLLTEPYVGNALEAGCHLLARGDEMTPIYQATCGAASRTWARENADTLVRYIRAYVKATRWSFDTRNRRDCLDLLAKHHGIVATSAERTLKALLDPKHGLYPNAELNLPGIAAALELRAGMGHLARPVPPAEKYVDLSYYRKAVGSD
ncbi:MAG: ABC transporter substrate-binding protein [Candidatus Binatia bacterium]